MLRDEEEEQEEEVWDGCPYANALAQAPPSLLLNVAVLGATVVVGVLGATVVVASRWLGALA